MIKSAVSSNGHSAVMVSEYTWVINGREHCELHLGRYAPKHIGYPEHRAEFNELVKKAADKLGWKPDRRCKGGWRKTTV